MAFNKRNIVVQVLQFVGGLYPIKVLAGAHQHYGGKRITLDTGVHLAHNHQTLATEIISAAGAALTVGLKTAASTNAVHAAVTLATGATTVVTTAITNPDAPRNLVVVCNQASVGDGTYSSKCVYVTGTDQWGNTITEWIPCNGTTPVIGKKVFKTVTSITYPSRNAASDTCTLYLGPTLGLRRLCYTISDVIEESRKAAAATAYTVEAVSSLTGNVGECYGTISGQVTAAATTINILGTSVAGRWITDGGAITDFAGGSPGTGLVGVGFMKIMDGQGNTEEVYCSAIGALSAGVYACTVVRGLNGTTARAWDTAKVQMMTFNSLKPGTAITADDRLQFTFLTRSV